MEKDWDSVVQKHLQAAVQIHPNSAEPHNMLGGIYFDAATPAREQFQNAIRLNNNYAEAHYRLGLVYQKLGKTADAEREMRAAQSLSK